MPLIKREDKGSKLTSREMDDNLQFLLDNSAGSRDLPLRDILVRDDNTIIDEEDTELLKISLRDSSRGGHGESFAPKNVTQLILSELITVSRTIFITENPRLTTIDLSKLESVLNEEERVDSPA